MKAGIQVPIPQVDVVDFGRDAAPICGPCHRECCRRDWQCPSAVSSADTPAPLLAFAGGVELQYGCQKFGSVATSRRRAVVVQVLFPEASPL